MSAAGLNNLRRLITEFECGSSVLVQWVKKGERERGVKKRERERG